MTIWCKHVHRLELQKFFLIFMMRIHQLVLDNYVNNKKYGNFVSISKLTVEC